MSYLAASDETEEEAGGDGAEELGDPVEDAAEEGDVAADEEAEGDGGVDVAAGDVGGDGDGDEEGQAVCQGCGDDGVLRGGAVVGELVEGDPRPWPRENEDQGGDELRQRRPQGIGMRGIVGPTDGNVADRHRSKNQTKPIGDSGVVEVVVAV